MRWTEKEKKLIKTLQQEKLSPSHEFDHLKRVAEYCFDLAKQYQAEREVVVGAALLHDLGRSQTKYRGVESAKRGAKLARSVLIKAGYGEKEIELIIRCIAEHDQPKFHSKLLEARVLKDADFLDGFGARGIMRSIMYAGETSGGVREAVQRMKIKARKRLEGLEFVESKRLGWKLNRLTEMFLVELGKGAALFSNDYRGKFIVLEGISGSGKDTQAEKLKKYLQRKKIKVTLVNHPTPFLKELWKLWKTKVDDRMSEVYLMLADRVRMVRSVILPALKDGMVVISTRSQISAQAYQQVEGVDPAYFRYLFAFEPVADLYLYLKLFATEALKRTDTRVNQGKEKDRGFFGKKQELQLKGFSKVLKFYPNVVTIDANPDPDTVFKSILKVIIKYNILVP